MTPDQVLKAADAIQLLRSLGMSVVTKDPLASLGEEIKAAQAPAVPEAAPVKASHTRSTLPNYVSQHHLYQLKHFVEGLRLNTCFNHIRVCREMGWSRREDSIAAIDASLVRLPNVKRFRTGFLRVADLHIAGQVAG